MITFAKFWNLLLLRFYRRRVHNRTSKIYNSHLEGTTENCPGNISMAIERENVASRHDFDIAQFGPRAADKKMNAIDYGMFYCVLVS